MLMKLMLFNDHLKSFCLNCPEYSYHSIGARVARQEGSHKKAAPVADWDTEPYHYSRDSWAHLLEAHD